MVLGVPPLSPIAFITLVDNISNYCLNGDGRSLIITFVTITFMTLLASIISWLFNKCDNGHHHHQHITNTT